MTNCPLAETKMAAVPLRCVGVAVPVEVGLDPLLDQPERMMGLVVQVAANRGQDLWCDIGEVVARVRAAQHLHGLLANQRPGGGAVCAEPSAGHCAAIGPKRRRAAAMEP